MNTTEITEFDKRVLEVCNYLVNHRSTSRLTAYRFEISPTTVTNYVKLHLKELDPELYERASRLLKLNSHDRGNPI